MSAETLAQAYERGRRHGFRRHGFHNRIAAYMEAKEQFTIADALDADAFRLAVRLRLKTAFYDNAPPELHLPRQCAVAIKDGKFFATPYRGDDCAAMRAAIYAAAEENK